MKKTEQDLSWFDLPHMVANGKFYVIHDDMAIPSEIEGIDSLNGSFIVERRNLSIKDCTLIGRRIRDITLQELLDCPYLVDTFYTTYKDVVGVDDEEKRLYLKNRLYNLLYRFDIKAYLSTLGIYPFDNVHFKPDVVEHMNGEKHVNPAIVIDIKTLKRDYNEQ